MPRCRRSCLTFWTSCPRRGGYQPPAGAYYAPLQMPGWGLAAAWHTGAAPLSGRAAPSYFLSFSWGTPERRPPSQVTRIPQGRLSAARGRMLCAPANAGVGAGGGTARRGRPLVRQGGPVLLSFLFVGNAGTAPPFSSDPHPAGAAISRPRAHAMRPCKCRGGGWRRHGTSVPPLSIPQNTAHHVSQRGAPLDSAALGAARRRTL